MEYADQVELRRSWVTSLLGREVETVPMQNPWNHRSKMEFTFGQEGDRVTLGLHQRNSFSRIVEIEQCEIAHPEVSRLLRAIREAAGRSSLSSYNNRRHEGFWRYAVIRVSRSTGELLLVLMTNEGPREPLKAMAEELPRQVPALKSFYWGVTPKRSDVARPDRLERLWGAETLEDSVGPVRYRFGPSNFLQPNHALVEKAYGAIRAGAGLTGREAVYDLYCGIGLIGLSLAGGAGEVHGVESEPENIEFAERNAEMNGISNARFYCGRVEDLMKGGALFRGGPAPDVIVVDPPRVGLHKEVLTPLLDARALRLVYLSCNPASLARDLKTLTQAYRIESLKMFDFFPHTEHSEVLAILTLT
jgi:23S rRNA (uracil1939-C5)-methyltransferase